MLIMATLVAVQPCRLFMATSRLVAGDRVISLQQSCYFKQVTRRSRY